MAECIFLKVLFLVAITTTAAARNVRNGTNSTALPLSQVSTVSIGASPATVITDANGTTVTPGVPDATPVTATTPITGDAVVASTTVTPAATPVTGDTSVAVSAANVPDATPIINATSSSTSTIPNASAAPGVGGNSGGGTNSGTATTPTTGTTTPPTTPEPTTPSPCLGAANPSAESIKLCADEICAKKILEDLQLFVSCNKRTSKYINDHPTNMADLGEGLAKRIANNIERRLVESLPVNESVVIVTDQLAMGSSVIHSSMYTNTSRGVFNFPNISQEGVSAMLGYRVRNSISYAKKWLPTLNSGYVQVGWSISEVSKTTVPKSEIEEYTDIVWRLPIADMKIEKNKILIGKEKPNLVINSRVITFWLDPKPQSPLHAPLRITFQRFKNSDVENHMCYYWMQTSLSIGRWSSDGCSVVSSNDTHTVCSYTHMSTFVVLSEVYEKVDEGARKAVKVVAIVFCILAMAALIGTIHITRKLECLENDRVNIHINLCIMLLIGYFLFIIGVIKSDIKILNDILAIGLHFCQLSPLVWLCLEAVYFFNTIHPIFNYENTDTRKFYTSLGWALTAAFAGSTAGYDFPHNGKPLDSEFIWIFIDKVKVWYFLGPIIFLFLVNAFLRTATMIRLSKYTKISDNDKAPLRIQVNILTSLALLFVVFLAWYLGVKAVNNSETKGYHYGFLVMYCFQAFLVLIIYGWQNEEMWSLHSKRKEDARKIAERKIGIMYIP